MFNMKMMRAAAVAGVLAVPMASTAAAQRPGVVVGGGLVNVQIVDVIDGGVVNIDDINVALNVALGIAANICDVSVNVLAQDFRNGGAVCDSLVDGDGQIVTIGR